MRNIITVKKITDKVNIVNTPLVMFLVIFLVIDFSSKSITGVIDGKSSLVNKRVFVVELQSLIGFIGWQFLHRLV